MGKGATMTLSTLLGLAQWKAVGAAERLCQGTTWQSKTGSVPRLGIVLAAWDPGAAAAIGGPGRWSEFWRLRGVNWSIGGCGG